MPVSYELTVFTVSTQAPVEPPNAVSIRTSLEVEGGIFIAG